MEQVLSNKKTQNLILYLCFSAYALVYTGRLNLSIASTLLEDSAFVGKDQIGLLGSCFFAVYAVGRLINGSIGDRVPPKPFLIIGLMGSACCNVLMGLLFPVEAMYVIWAFNGWFQSMLWSAALINVSISYSNQMLAKRAAMILSVSVGVGTLLGVVIPTFLALLGLMQIFIVPGILIAIMCFILIIWLPNGQMAVPAKPKKEKINILRNPSLLRMLFPTVAHGVIKENLTLWIPLLFMEMYGLDLKGATFYIFLMPLATLLGRFLFPAWHRACNDNDRLTLFSAFACCTAMLLPFLFWSLPVWVSGLLLAGISVTTSIINAELLAVYPINFRKSNQVSSVAGILDCATYIGSAVGSAVFGFLISRWGFTSMISVWCALALASILIVLLEKQHTPKSI